MTTDIASAAVELAAQVPVFPCNGIKRPIVEGGFHAATTDVEAVRRMFSSPHAKLIGMPTGRITGVVVIDVDVKNGRDGGRWLHDNSDALPHTRTHITASGGVHLLFQAPPDVEIRNSVDLVAPGIDVRGDGGYVIVPPSPGYEVSNWTRPAPMPAWLVRACVRTAAAPKVAPEPPRVMLANGDGGSAYGLAALDDECDAIVNASFGQQETTLNSAALKIGRLIGGGELVGGYALARLLAAGRAMPSQPGRPAWSPREVEQKIRRAVEDGRRQPRQAPPSLPAPPRANGSGRTEPDEPGQIAPPTQDEAAETQDTAEPFPTLTLDELAALKPPEWLVHKVMAAGGNVVFYGPFASLKSFVVLDLALCVAFGRPWHGREVKQAGVIYVAGEGLAGFARRVLAWKRHHGLEDGNAPFRLLHVPVNLTSDEDVARMVATVQAAAKAASQPVGLILFDTVARAMVGADENSAQDMGRVVAATDRIRAASGATTVAVHHTGKDGDRGPRGSTALPGAVDTLVRVDRAELSVTLTIEKQKEDEEGDPIILQAQKVDLGVPPVDGAPVTSLVLVEGSPELSGSVRPSGRLTRDQQQALRILHEALAEHGEPDFPGVPPGLLSIPEDWWRERFYARAKPGAKPDAKQKAFRRAADDLVLARLVAANMGRVWTTRGFG